MNQKSEAPPADAPKPEREEPTVDDPGVRDLSAHDWFAITKRAAKGMLEDNMMMIASALAYSTFFAIPSVLLAAVGLFTLVAGPHAIETVMQHVGHVMPAQATQLVKSSLTRLDQHPNSGLVLTIVGFALALWSMTGAMTTYMTGINLAYGRKDGRNFVKKRGIALVMVAAIGFAFLLIAGLLIFGPPIEKWIGNLVGQPSLVAWLWWAAQWPILIFGLLAAFAVLLWLGPDVEHRHWQFLTVGSGIAVVIWLIVSGAFAYYTSKFGSYNKAWGSLAAVIIMLTWLWLTSLALLFGAEFNAEAESSRALRET